MKLLGSKPGFFNIGVTAAVVKRVGTVVSEEWMIVEQRGEAGFDKEGIQLTCGGLGFADEV